MIGLNESVKSTLLKEVCDEIATVHGIKFHRHPKTKTFLGAATVSFQHSGMGLKAMKELDGKIVGGCYLRAELDDNGKLSLYSSMKKEKNTHLCSVTSSHIQHVQCTCVYRQE